ncbi:unnamed protein product [Mytilus coruscus]|uniref:Uncharacterized protein n=1 Tax=Mytilus coruscus TaxID=42192 RepID=A0A6J8DKE6_MYTCO|nr:unnamed protein product [Mytilus coruscus]
MSTFIIDVCNCYINCISRASADLFPPPNAKGYTYHIHKLFHTLFQRIIKIDAVSGWLLYEFFYFATKQFKVTLRITDYVLSKWSPDLMFTDSTGNNDKQKMYYRHNVHSLMTLKDKLTIATAQHVHYRQHSPLIPQELHLESCKFGTTCIIRGRCPPGTCTGTELYLSIQAFLDSIMRCYTNMQPCIHGPCISNKDQTVDFAYCIRSKYLPYNAISWATRHRSRALADLLPPPNAKGYTYHIHKLFHTLFQRIIKIDAVSVTENEIQSVNTESNELTILGVCFEISGDKDMAYQCYDEALQCGIDVCSSAEERRSKLCEI